MPMNSADSGDPQFETFSVTPSGVEFTIRLVSKGEKYGLDFCLTHDETDPLVEFYYGRFSHSDFGRMGVFAGRYYARTILESSHQHGLCLDGGTPGWTLPPEAMAIATQWLRQRMQSIHDKRHCT